MASLLPLEIFINHIEKEGETIHGIAAWNKTVEENLNIIFRGDKALHDLKFLIKNLKEPFYTFARFCQFVVYIQYQPVLGLTMVLTDFKNDTDAALDYYKQLREKDWNKADVDKILSIFQEIQNDKTNIAKLVMKEPIP